METHIHTHHPFFTLPLVGGGGGEHTVTYDKPELREQLQSQADAGTAPSE